MRKIYYVTNMFPSKKDNYGIFCKKTYDFFESSNDFKVIKISAIYGKSQNKYFNILRYIGLLASIFVTIVFQQNKFDIIYIQYVWKHAFFISHFAPILRKKKIFINFHGEDLTKYEQLSSKDKVAFNKLCDISVGIVVPSEYFKDLLISTTKKVLQDKIIVTPSGGVDSTRFFLKNKNLHQTRVVYCSRFDENKGWDDFIKATELLVNAGKDYKFSMIGYGKETNLVQNMISEKKLHDKIGVIINPKQEEISKIYTESDIFIFPTRRKAESLGLVALEAMSCGLPVIASNIGAIGEYIDNSENGFLIEPGDYVDLSNKINDFFILPDEKRLNMQQKAYEKAELYRDEKIKLDFLNEIKNKA